MPWHCSVVPCILPAFAEPNGVHTTQYFFFACKKTNKTKQKFISTFVPLLPAHSTADNACLSPLSALRYCSQRWAMQVGYRGGSLPAAACAWAGRGCYIAGELLLYPHLPFCLRSRTRRTPEMHHSQHKNTKANKTHNSYVCVCCTVFASLFLLCVSVFLVFISFSSF